MNIKRIRNPSSPPKEIPNRRREVIPCSWLKSARMLMKLLLGFFSLWPFPPQTHPSLPEGSFIVRYCLNKGIDSEKCVSRWFHCCVPVILTQIYAILSLYSRNHHCIYCLSLVKIWTCTCDCINKISMLALVGYVILSHFWTNPLALDVS